MTISEQGPVYYDSEGVVHREDGPAIIWPNGSKFWYINGERHREDGPAIEYSRGYKARFINGRNITNSVIQWKKEMGIANDILTKEESALFVLYFGQ